MGPVTLCAPDRCDFRRAPAAWVAGQAVRALYAIFSIVEKIHAMEFSTAWTAVPLLAIVLAASAWSFVALRRNYRPRRSPRTTALCQPREIARVCRLTWPSSARLNHLCGGLPSTNHPCLQPPEPPPRVAKKLGVPTYKDRCPITHPGV